MEKYLNVYLKRKSNNIYNNDTYEKTLMIRFHMVYTNDFIPKHV